MKQTNLQIRNGFPEEMPKNPLWDAVRAYFVVWFKTNKDQDKLTLTANELAKEMGKLKSYDAEVIVHLLKRGFEVTPGVYVFDRDTFINPLKNRLEGVDL